MENNRYIDQRALNHQGLLEKAKALQRANGVFDLGRPREIDYGILRRLHELLERAGARPIKSQKILTVPEFVEKLGRTCQTQIGNGGIITAEFAVDGMPLPVKVQGRVGDFNGAYFVFEKLREQIRKEDR